ncbi:cilia- and flagella-associated protein 43-like [Scylla paramamosain]|uniref:cilia- and flagella-associated protein 43-like n=1 Tax=Scylla paramamosain TaxID=85552 RepID=UPI003082FE20
MVNEEQGQREGEGEGEGPLSPHQELKTDVDRLCGQLEALLGENSALDHTQQLPVTEFTLNPRRLAALQDKLVTMELSVVRGVERSRLEKLLQCHYLKEAAWDSMIVKARSLSCICSDVKVRNYPIAAPAPGTWPAVLEVVSTRLREVEASKNMETLSNIAMKAGVWRKTLIPGEGKTPSNTTSRSLMGEGAVKGLLDLDKGDFKTPAREEVEEVQDGEGEEEEEEEEEDGEPVLGEDEYRRLLYPQGELTCRGRVEKQLILLTFLTRRLRESFNKRFDNVHQRKEKVIEEIKRLTRKRIQLKEELARIREEGEAGGGGGEGSLSRTHSREEQQEEEEEEEKGDYEPSWEIEERPELMLRVEDSEITSEEPWDEEYQPSPSSAVPRPSLPPSQSQGLETPSEGDIVEFLSGARQGTGKQGSKDEAHALLEAQRSQREWTWAEARAWREWRAAQEEEVRQRRAHLTTLVLQLERITPTITSLLQEFDGQVMALVDSRVATDEALMLYQVVTSSLHRRLVRQDQLQDTLRGLQQQQAQVEEKVQQATTEESNTRREEGRARTRQERLQEQLKEEEVVLRRALINLPIDQYNHLLALYSKRVQGGGRHLDPSIGKGEGGASGPPTPLRLPSYSSLNSPSRNRTVSPATPEKLSAAGRGSARPSRPPSSTSHSDDLRSVEESMPEGLAGGIRTWRLFLRHRRRRQELLEELDDAAGKRASATAHLQAMDARRTQLLKEAKQLEEAIGHTTEELRQVDEDAEMVLVLRGRQVKVDLLAMTQNLRPDFIHSCLVRNEELRRLENMAERCVESEGKEGAEGEGEEAETLRTLREQLQLEVELARQDLHHINTFKVGRDVIAAAAAEGGEQKDPSHMYASLQRLQQLQGQRAESAAVASSKVEREVRRSRRRVNHLQKHVDELAREIDDLQAQVTQAQPEVHLAKQETRLRRVMACNDLSAQVRQRHSTILDLQAELDTLRLRTFPMLSRPAPPPTL